MRRSSARAACPPKRISANAARPAAQAQARGPAKLSRPSAMPATPTSAAPANTALAILSTATMREARTPAGEITGVFDAITPSLATRVSYRAHYPIRPPVVSGTLPSNWKVWKVCAPSRRFGLRDVFTPNRRNPGRHCIAEEGPPFPRARRSGAPALRGVLNACGKEISSGRPART